MKVFLCFLFLYFLQIGYVFLLFFNIDTFNKLGQLVFPLFTRMKEVCSILLKKAQNYQETINMAVKRICDLCVYLFLYMFMQQPYEIFLQGELL